MVYQSPVNSTFFRWKRTKKKKNPNNTKKATIWTKRCCGFISFVRLCKRLLLTFWLCVDRIGIVSGFLPDIFFALISFLFLFVFISCSQILNHLIDVYFNINIVSLIFNQFFCLIRTHTNTHHREQLAQAHPKWSSDWRSKCAWMIPKSKMQKYKKRPQMNRLRKIR